jgi:hypothetical protein
LARQVPVIAHVVDPQNPTPTGEPCESCGAPVEFDDPYCAACGAQRRTGQIPPELPQTVRAGRAAEPQVPEKRLFQCKNCGSRVAIDARHRSYICAFCDSNYVVEFSPQMTDRHPIEFIIGFAVTPDQAHDRFRKWIQSNSWFRPGDLDRARIEQKLVGAYMPFWSFSMLAQSNWSANIGEYWYRTETYTTRDSKGNIVTRTRTVQETEWWPLHGKHHEYYSGYLVSGSHSLSQNEADQIKPFQLPAFRRYQPYYLAGWLSEEYSVEQQEALEICQHHFLEREQEHVAAFLPGDTFGGLDVRTSFSFINSDLCLLPIYVWSYRYRDRLYRFLVNGQTGKVAGQKPVSGTRVTIFVLLILMVIGAIVMASLLMAK